MFQCQRRESNNCHIFLSPLSSCTVNHAEGESNICKYVRLNFSLSRQPVRANVFLSQLSSCYADWPTFVPRCSRLRHLTCPSLSCNVEKTVKFKSREWLLYFLSEQHGIPLDINFPVFIIFCDFFSHVVLILFTLNLHFFEIYYSYIYKEIRRCKVTYWPAS
jgi:hypothetical protein